MAFASVLIGRQTRRRTIRLRPRRRGRSTAKRLPNRGALFFSGRVAAQNPWQTSIPTHPHIPLIRSFLHGCCAMTTRSALRPESPFLHVCEDGLRRHRKLSRVGWTPSTQHIQPILAGLLHGIGAHETTLHEADDAFTAAFARVSATIGNARGRLDRQAAGPMAGRSKAASHRAALAHPSSFSALPYAGQPALQPKC